MSERAPAARARRAHAVDGRAERRERTLVLAPKHHRRDRTRERALDADGRAAAPRPEEHDAPALTDQRTQESFGASMPGETLGNHRKDSTETWNFVPLPSWRPASSRSDSSWV